MRTSIAAFGVGALFGLGLLVAGMTRPAAVIAFLDLLGGWDPSLGFVMAGAIGVHAVISRLAPRLGAPLLGGTLALPRRADVDAPLLGGAALFGVGWGLGGYCPGPALTTALTGPEAALFTGAMLAGMAAHALWTSRRPASADLQPSASGA